MPWRWLTWTEAGLWHCSFLGPLEGFGLCRVSFLGQRREEKKKKTPRYAFFSLSTSGVSLEAYEKRSVQFRALVQAYVCTFFSQCTLLRFGGVALPELVQPRKQFYVSLHTQRLAVVVFARFLFIKCTIHSSSTVPSDGSAAGAGTVFRVFGAPFIRFIHISGVLPTVR